MGVGVSLRSCSASAGRNPAESGRVPARPRWYRAPKDRRGETIDTHWSAIELFDHGEEQAPIKMVKALRVLNRSSAASAVAPSTRPLALTWRSHEPFVTAGLPPRCAPGPSRNRRRAVRVGESPKFAPSAAQFQRAPPHRTQGAAQCQSDREEETSQSARVVAPTNVNGGKSILSSEQRGPHRS